MLNNKTLLKGVDFNVGLKPVAFINDQKKVQEIPDKYAAVRLDTKEPMGIVGSRYEVVDHKNMLVNLNKVIRDISKDYCVDHTINGAKIYSRFTLNDRMIMRSDNNELSKIQILGINSYDGSKSEYILIQVLRLICSNGMGIWTSDSVLRKVHTKSIDIEKMVVALDANIEKYTLTYIDVYKKLKKEVPIKKEVLSKYQNVLPKKLIMKSLDTMEENSAKDAWGQYNAFTQLITRSELKEKTRLDYQKIVFSMFASEYSLS